MLNTLSLHGVKSLQPRCSYCAIRERRLLLQAQRCRPAIISRQYHHNRPLFSSAVAERDLRGERDHQIRDYHDQKQRKPQQPSDARTRKPRERPSSRSKRHARDDNSHDDQKSSRPSRGRSSTSNRDVRRLVESAKSSDALAIRIRRGAQPDEFAKTLMRNLDVVGVREKDGDLIKTIAAERGESPNQTFKLFWTRFKSAITRSDDAPIFDISVDDQPRIDRAAVMQDLRKAYKDGGQVALHARIKYVFYDSFLTPGFSETIRRNQSKLADLRYPGEWFTAARQDSRKFHLHVGPTNSGKTYQALKRLEQVQTSGVYAGPLRLLAHEVFSRMNAKGLPCYMITGEERRTPVAGNTSDLATQQKIFSCTVEMIPLQIKHEVAVIDEIQMISDPWRGWAWTQALLGVRAKEVHLCGEERAVPLIREICASLGEELVVHHYERLSPLQPDKASLRGDLTKLRKGDCIVSFSVMGIHALKKQIEEKTGRKVAVVYGGLPAETRSQQAQLFNDPDNDYDFLVASDAIGMGLNLAIKRVIFETVAKHDGTGYRLLDVAHIKQIAGRAGRYRTAQQATSSEQSVSTAKGDPRPAQKQSVGLVTTLEDVDLPVVEKALTQVPPPLTKAGIVPPTAMFEQFASYFPPETPFTYLIQKMWDLSSSVTTYFTCSLKDVLWIADAIEPVKGLTMRERYAFCAVPAGGRTSPVMPRLLPAYARCIAEQKCGEIADIEELPLEVLDVVNPADKKGYLRQLESLHQALVCYMWLSFRFAGAFPQRALAKHVTELTEAKIAEALGSFAFSEKARLAMAAARNAQLLKNEAEREAAEIAERVQAEAAHKPLLASESDSDDIGIDELEDAEAGKTSEEHAERPIDLETDASTPPSDSVKEVLPLESDGLFAGYDHPDPNKPGVEDQLDGSPKTESERVRRARLNGDLPLQGQEDVPSSFAAWRTQQRPGESQASHEP